MEFASCGPTAESALRTGETHNRNTCCSSSFQQRACRRKWLASPHSRTSCRQKGLQVLRRAASSSSWDSTISPSKVEDRRRYLLQYVQDINPDIMEHFVDHAPAEVVDAMRQTVTNMLGTLPPQFFQVTISTLAENLAQLMYTVILTGYMFRNAQYRLDLRSTLSALPSAEVAQPDLIGSGVGEVAGGWADGSQKTRVAGEVVRWNHDTGAQAIPAAQYIETLEAEIAMLRQQITAQVSGRPAGNQLLNYLKTLEPANSKELTDCAGDDVLEAINSFIQRLLGTGDEAELRATASESNAVELARLLYWLMVVGYTLRTLEVRFDMQESLRGDRGAPGELPPPSLPPAK